MAEAIGGQVIQGGVEGFRLCLPFLQGFRTVKSEQLSPAELRITGIGEPGDLAGRLVVEGQRLLILDPLQLGGGISG